MKISRLNAIEQHILLNETVKIDDLCEIFTVSKNTIRRDLNELETRGHIAKVYGGVTAVKPKDIIPVPVRNNLNASSKVCIAELASKLVNDGDTIFIDSGSTVVNMVEYLSLKNKITIITHSLNVVSQASKFPNINIIGLGGVFLPTTGSFVGLSTLETLDSIKINKAFMAASGVSIDGGLSNNTFLEAEIKKKIASRSKEIHLLCDATKINSDATVSFCCLKELTTLITDKKPDDVYIDYCKANNINLIYSF